MRRRGAVWLAWGIGGTSLALAALSWLLHAKNAAVPLPTSDERLPFPPLVAGGVMLVFCLPAALIVSRQPRNPTGWLLAAIGYGMGVGAFAGEYGFYTVVTAPGSLPGGILLAWLADASLPTLLFYGPVPLLLLLFPDGRLLSRPWRRSPGPRPRPSPSAPCPAPCTRVTSPATPGCQKTPPASTGGPTGSTP